ATLAGGARARVEVAASDGADSDALMRVLAIVRERTGHDLSQYKHTAIERRLARRLIVHRLDDLEAYVEYLAANPEEAELLFRELLIGVTHFFRDEDAFLVLRDAAVPALLDARPDARALRAWVAGCSTGEEAYSLAIVLHEVIRARAGASPVAVQIYATDIDDEAVATARAGRYSQDIEQHVSSERLARYFVREDHGYRIKKEIRDTVVFAKHDLINDPPFTHLDILSCRNVLIYLQPALQRELLPRFHYALGPGGLLVLGVSESVGATADLFAPVDAKAKVFRALATANRAPLPGLPVRTTSSPSELRAGGGPTVIDAARNAIVDAVAPPTVLINERGDILYSSRRTGRYLEPAVGKTNINIFAMAREGLGPHLSLAVRQAIARHRRVTFAGLTVRGERTTSVVDLSVVPLDDPPSLHKLLLVVFEPAPSPEKGRSARGRTRRSGKSDLERELARMKQQLTTVVREMEASSAQVESANEQLQAANEELQSTNEELTTSKEELQSLNEELLTLNTELEVKNEELTVANDDLRNLLDSSKIPTLFLDGALRLKRFTSEATRVANLRPIDVGRVITDITLRIDYRDLARDVADVLETLVFKEVQVSGAGGVRYTMRIHPYRTTDNRIDGVVITFFERS
ncbi:MAG: chemotaxis protein CheB, partial [Kofleriaceae bacterium]